MIGREFKEGTLHDFFILFAAVHFWIWTAQSGLKVSREKNLIKKANGALMPCKPHIE